jgi:CheY-like chemotaxis protein
MILTSAHDEAQQALAKGASLFLHKPVDGDTLTRELRRLTSHTGTRRLLLVDDNEVSRYIVRELLDRPWLDIAEAGNGSEAIRLIDEHTPDAVILDLLMPDIGGLQVLRRLRERAATEDLPVLIYTSKVLSKSEKAELESLGAKLVRKEDVSTRLSAQPFFDWLASEGLAPEAGVSEKNA